MPSWRSRPSTIRQYRRGDDGQIWALAGLASEESASAGSPVPLPIPDAEGPPPDCPDLADIDRSYLRSGGDFIVAELDGHIVGTVGLLVRDDGDGDVVRVVVHPAVRRRGIGTALVEAVERRAIGLEIKRLNLDVGSGQQDAIAFYLAAGFRQLDEDEDETNERWDANFFSKALKVLP